MPSIVASKSTRTRCQAAVGKGNVPQMFQVQQAGTEGDSPPPRPQQVSIRRQELTLQLPTSLLPHSHSKKQPPPLPAWSATCLLQWGVALLGKAFIFKTSKNSLAKMPGAQFSGIQETR